MKKESYDPLIDGFYSEFYERARAQQEAFLLLRRALLRYQATGGLLDAVELDLIAPHENHLVLSNPERWLLNESKRVNGQSRRRFQPLAAIGLLMAAILLVLTSLVPWVFPPASAGHPNKKISASSVSAVPEKLQEGKAPIAQKEKRTAAPLEKEPETVQKVPKLVENEGVRIGLGSGCFKVKKAGKWGVVDEKGKEILAASFDAIQRFHPSKGLFIIEREGKRGIANARGEVLLHPFFDEVTTHFPQTGLFVVTKEGKQGVYDFEQQQFALGLEFKEICCYSEGLFGVRLEDGSWGFADRRSRLILPTTYDAIVKPFKNGQALVVQDGQEIYIDLAGTPLASKD